MRSQKEIDAETQLVRALKPVGPLASKTKAAIELVIEELEYGIDNTAEEWWDFTDFERDAVVCAKNWQNGDKARPSEYWDELVKK